jgi:hypothetical protein
MILNFPFLRLEPIHSLLKWQHEVSLQFNQMTKSSLSSICSVTELQGKSAAQHTKAALESSTVN